MRTLKSVLAGIVFFIVCLVANASIKPATGKPNRDEVLKIYIDAVTSGNVSNLKNVLADDLQFDIIRGKNVGMLTKSQLVDYLKNNDVSDLSVKTTTTVEQEDDNSSVMKVEFKYDGYSRTDQVTLYKTTGWLITRVVSVFK